MSQPILLVVTEITPGINASLRKKDPGTHLFRPEKAEKTSPNNKETQHRVHNQSGAPEKSGGYSEENT
jgi:hypothetical protein